MSLADLERGLTSLVRAIPAYQQADRYYVGSPDEVFHTPSLQRKLAKLQATGMRLNLAKTVVDAVANRIEVAGVTTNDEKADEALSQLWEDNELDVELPGLFERALVYGDAYLMLDGNDQDGVNLFYNSPLIMRVIYRADNPRVKDFAIKRWLIQGATSGDTYQRVNLIYADRVERYITSVAGNTGEKAADYQPYVSDDPEDTESVVANAYGFIPVYHLRTARPYGRPEHKDAYGPQDGVNKIAINHMASIDFLGFPQRYFLMEEGKLDSDVTDPDLLNLTHDEENPSATVTSPTVRPSTLTSEVGGVWEVYAKSVGQFAPADSKNFIESVNHYRELIAQVTTTPFYYLNAASERPPSGEALRTVDGPLIKKVTRRCTSFGGALQDALDDALYVLGVEGAKTRVHWSSPSTSNDIDSWKVVSEKVALGIPIRQALIEQGYTPDQLDKWGLNDVAKPEASQASAAKQQTAAEVLQKVYLAVTAGVITRAEARAIANNAGAGLTDDENLPAEVEAPAA